MTRSGSVDAARHLAVVALTLAAIGRTDAIVHGDRTAARDRHPHALGAGQSRCGLCCVRVHDRRPRHRPGVLGALGFTAESTRCSGLTPDTASTLACGAHSARGNRGVPRSDATGDAGGSARGDTGGLKNQMRIGRILRIKAESSQHMILSRRPWCDSAPYSRSLGSAQAQEYGDTPL